LAMGHAHRDRACPCIISCWYPISLDWIPLWLWFLAFCPCLFYFPIPTSRLLAKLVPDHTVW
jgi:hypothetical protein